MFYLTSKLDNVSLYGLVQLRMQDEIWVLPGCCMMCDAPDAHGWQLRYGSGRDNARTRINQVLLALGASESRIHYWNYFEPMSEELRQQMSGCNYLILPGGMMELGIERLREAGLDRVLTNYTGSVIANSAGALLLFAQYMVSPNRFYPEFQIVQGLGILQWDSFLEVHYHPDCVEQRQSIDTVLKRCGVPVYALEENGALVLQDGKVVRQRNCHVFLPECYPPDMKQKAVPGGRFCSS